MTKTFKLVAWAILTVTSASADAALITFSSRPSWQTAAGPSTATQNFNGFVADMGTTAPVNLGGGMSVSSVTTTVLPWTIDVPPLSNALECSVDGTAELCGFNGNVLTFSFSPGISAFGADFSSMNDDAVRTRFEVFSGSTLIATLTAPTVVGQVDQFFGFVATAGESITSFRTLAVQPDTFGIDNIAIVAGAAVPEPGSIALLGVALAGLGFSRRKQ